MTNQLQKTSDLSVACVLADWIESVEVNRLPVELVHASEDTLIDTMQAMRRFYVNPGQVRVLVRFWANLRNEIL